MSRAVSGFNPRVFAWARKLAGLSIEDVALAMKRDVADVAGWESGESAPTYPQLETLAYRVLKRPTALFFFPEPPDEPAPEQSFRTLPDFELSQLSSETRYRIRDALALVASLYDLNDGRNLAERKIFRDVPLDVEEPVSEAAARVRRYLSVNSEFQRQARSVDEALAAWRAKIEDVGIFVFKNSFKQRDVSGFCLYDAEFPIIYINNSTAKTRQIFTLFHELVHLLLGVSTVTRLDDDYIASLSPRERHIELYCNAFAAEFLLPQDEFRRRIEGESPSNEVVSEIASEFKVSREVVLRRFLDAGLVSRSDYLSRTAAWNRDREASAGEGGGGNYYFTKAAYLGDSFLELAFRRYHQGAISLTDLADHLGMKARNVAVLEHNYLRRQTA